MEITQTEGKQSKAEVRQFLTFMIGGEEYAVGLLTVKEIIEYDTVTRIPKMPEWVRGVINLRGSVVPVIDLAIKFGQGSKPAGKLTCIVIMEAECEGEATVMGIITDEVSQVIELTHEDIEPPPAFGTKVRVDYLLGMARSGKKFSLILDTDKVLSADELLSLPTTTEMPQEESNVSQSGRALPGAGIPAES
jgi:purine-binding chemotaxis protein CheW